MISVHNDFSITYFVVMQKNYSRTVSGINFLLQKYFSNWLIAFEEIQNSRKTYLQMILDYCTFID